MATTVPLPTLSPAVLDAALAGLTCAPKSLPPWLFYDERGSQLFEAITELPEYYLTRAERAIFLQHGAEIVSALGGPITLAELGAGSCSKTGVLLAAATAQQGEVLYEPIDISPTALAEAERTLRAALPTLQMQPVVANYITEPYELTRRPGHHVLALYIGSSIGNFAPTQAAAILLQLRQQLQPGDALLLGTDLAPGEHKSVATLVAAYDDAAGVTAAFNRNMLVRLNRELGADFVPASFAHRARWNAKCSRMEMHLESEQAQTVRLADRQIRFAAGETIHTENSYKFTAAAIEELLRSAGFAVARQWRDAEQRFAVTLAATV